MLDLSTKSHSFMLAMSVVILLAVLTNAPNPFIYAYLAYNTFLVIAALKFKDFNTFVLGTLILSPYFLEQIIFNFGFISLSSTEENRLYQNSLIFGVQLIINLIVLYPIVKRYELQEKYWPSSKVKMSLGDQIFPWLILLSTVKCFTALVENYFRNGLGYNIQFFYSIFDITGFINLSITTAVMTTLVFESYTDFKLSKIPRILKKKSNLK
ncbi:hypothetical protein PALB_23520 [Pseudoalteromonas luteoviolacea B = ATCC 29581]|nr:hypothetical protein PALB_23520 [Pseudoalteromonas luteoviolacea B = ATCC 29581]